MTTATSVEVWVVEVWKAGQFLARTVFDLGSAAMFYANDAAKRGCQAYWWRLDT